MCQPRIEGVEWDSTHTEDVEWDSTHTEKVPHETQVSLRQQILTHHKCLFGVRIKLLFSVSNQKISSRHFGQTLVTTWPAGGWLEVSAYPQETGTGLSKTGPS